MQGLRNVLELRGNIFFYLDMPKPFRNCHCNTTLKPLNMKNTHVDTSMDIYLLNFFYNTLAMRTIYKTNN